MSATLTKIYNDQYHELVAHRLDLIYKLEHINNEIERLKIQARKEKVELVN